MAAVAMAETARRGCHAPTTDAGRAARRRRSDADFGREMAAQTTSSNSLAVDLESCTVYNMFPSIIFARLLKLKKQNIKIKTELISF
jgi:hypothetical protein